MDRAIVRMLPAVPRPLVQKLSGRYIAGPELKDARETVRQLNADGQLAQAAGGSLTMHKAGLGGLRVTVHWPASA